MSTRALIPYGDSSFALRCDLPSEYGAVTTAFVTINDTAGSNKFTGSITKFEDVGGTAVKATSASHGMASGDKVTITGTTSYNGTFTLTAADTNSFTWTDTFVADDATGTWVGQFACAPKSISTLGAATVAGADEMTLGATVTTAPVSGDLIQIRANTGGPAESFVVDHYTTSTKVVTTKEWINHAHASGATVYGRWLTDAIDFSSSTLFPAGQELVFLWTGFDTDDLPFQTTGEIMRASVGGSDLQTRFNALYPHYWDRVKDDWATYQDAAFEELRMAFLANRRDIEKLVESYSITALWLAQIAYSVAWAGGDGDEAERVAMRTRRDELLAAFNALPLWIDDDQDGAIDDDETSQQDRPAPRRCLR